MYYISPSYVTFTRLRCVHKKGYTPIPRHVISVFFFFLFGRNPYYRGTYKRTHEPGNNHPAKCPSSYLTFVAHSVHIREQSEGALSLDTLLGALVVEDDQINEISADGCLASLAIWERRKLPFMQNMALKHHIATQAPRRIGRVLSIKDVFV